jgi:hypothetical protein
MGVVSGVCCGVAMAGAVALAACGSGPSTGAPSAAGTAREAPGSPAQGVLARGTGPVSAASVERALVAARTPPALLPGSLPTRGRAPSEALTAASCHPVAPRMFSCSLTFGSTPSRFTVRVQGNGDIIARRQGGGGPGPSVIGVWSTAGR